MARSSPLEVVVRGHIDALRRSLPHAAEGDVEALHDARVSTRRLREALRLLGAAGRSHRVLQHDLRRLTRRLGAVRELDVALGNLQELQLNQRVPRAPLTILQHLIETERLPEQAKLRRAIEATELRKVRDRALRVAHRTAGTSGRIPARRRESARRYLALRAGQLRASIDHAGDAYSPGRLHAVRIAAKKLRYAVEAAVAVMGARPPLGMIGLTTAQDLLGRMHDFEVLISRTVEVHASSAADAAGRPVNVARVLRFLERQCRQLHARYIGLRPSLLAVCDRTDRAVRHHEGD